MKIIFDLDHTLFSAQRFYQTLQKSFWEVGVNKKLFSKTYEKSKETDEGYNPLNQFKLISKEKPEISVKKQKEILDKTLANLEKFLYPDTPPFLKEAKRKYDLYVLSYGSQFQQTKIKRLRLRKFFNKILITREINKTSALKKALKKDEKAIFIDDNPKTLSELKKCFPGLITIRINRGEGRYTHDANNPQIDFLIKNIRELKKVLDKIAENLSLP